MNVREGRPRDLPRLRAIQSATLAEPWPELLPAAVEGPPPLYVLGDPPLAYAAVVTDGESAAYVPEFAVHPDHQRAGHGSRLLAFLRDRLAAEGYAELRLTVRTDDDARSFYAHHGFEPLERLEDHFEEGDGLLLALSLDDSDAGAGTAPD
jgi:ribosomal-protein-alanine N-acetyltransferase